MEGERHLFGGLLLGKYRVERVLGEGGTSIVVAARNEATGGLFAVKLLRHSLSGDRATKARFLAEARRAARLRSAHAVRVFDVGELACGTPYLLMEYLEGADLREVLSKRGPLAVPEAIDWMLEALDAVSEAHALGIVHSDLKPENLFVVANRDFTTSIRVLDFGVSRERGAVEPPSCELASREYLAPEELHRPTPAELASDVWSLGVVFHELLTGERPAARPASPLRARRPDVPRELEALVLGCLAPEPERRPSAIQLTARLLRLRDRLVWRRGSRAAHPARRAIPRRVEPRPCLRRTPRRGFRVSEERSLAPPARADAPPLALADARPHPTRRRRAAPSARLAIVVAICALLLACGAAGLSRARPGAFAPEPQGHLGSH